ncbi:hypothetical protein like AT5G24080 [Hibiscus trionum]|uniref:Receptor-like serine/threonine-protein kinase n=1 Tax=Hibiscus trionum TaxID=183268 RepID=A0A9W7HJD5_HIBTR|nr:hypothetical protein like AT5G24080 [Hibiscus trionum]
MGSLYLSLVLSLMSLAPLRSSAAYPRLNQGSHLSPENPGDVIISPGGTFSAGFYPIGLNAYAFAVWFSKPTCCLGHNCTVVWMANRDHPVNGRRTKLSLVETGNLVLIDAAQFHVWATDTATKSKLTYLQLAESGNLVLRDSERTILWQSFDYPTDTLLPLQPLSRLTQLVSSRGKGNYSSGFYNFFFDDDNVLRLLFDGHETSSVYWPYPWLLSWLAGRSTFNSSRHAMIDLLGNFSSTDDLIFRSADYGRSRIQRRLTLDYDGNLRLYSRGERDETWVVSWQAMSQPCMIHGVCGENSLCSYAPNTGRTCSCLQGYKQKNPTDWSYGCEPEFDKNANDFTFIPLPNAEFYGDDSQYLPNKTFKECEAECLQSVNCKGFQYKFSDSDGFYNCFPKALLRNGHQTPNFNGDIYIKLPKSYNMSNRKKEHFHEMLDCPKSNTFLLERSYAKRQENGIVKFMLWFAILLGGVEIISILLVWLLLYRASQDKNASRDGYVFAAAGFKRFTFDELKEATRNFHEEIGRGGGGTVYKGMLSDGRVIAVKRLNDSNHGEAEFLAEVNTIGKLNHMNLIEMWGFCADKKHRLLVYEYMEHGSLADMLSSTSNELDWQKKYDIALGTARGLAYLHDECLEWVLHCDVKPQNILLDTAYNPKVSDFGLSKLLDRSKLYNSSFSKIRGTRGYMAPEWVFNQPITSKVDVYSYGVVVLEMVTGKSPIRGIQLVYGGESEKESNSMESWRGEIVESMLEGNNEKQKLEILVGVALDCVQEDRDARPTMSQVVERLLHSSE